MADTALPAGSVSFAYLPQPGSGYNATISIPANPARQEFWLQNTSATFAFLGLGVAPSAGLGHVRLGPSGANDSIFRSSYKGAVYGLQGGPSGASIPYHEIQ